MLPQNSRPNQTFPHSVECLISRSIQPGRVGLAAVTLMGFSYRPSPRLANEKTDRAASALDPFEARWEGPLPAGGGEPAGPRGVLGDARMSLHHACQTGGCRDSGLFPRDGPECVTEMCHLGRGVCRSLRSWHTASVLRGPNGREDRCRLRFGRQQDRRRGRSARRRPREGAPGRRPRAFSESVRRWGTSRPRARV